MSKRAPQPTRAGQLAGAKIKIVGVSNIESMFEESTNTIL